MDSLAKRTNSALGLSAVIVGSSAIGEAVAGAQVQALSEAISAVTKVRDKDETCYYCGRPLDSLSGKPKRRKELATWHKLHPACAQSWDNESRR